MTPPTTTVLTRTDTGALAEVFEKLFDPKQIDIAKVDGQVPVAMLPNGVRLESLKVHFDQWATKPDRRTGTAHVRDAKSFVDHVNRQKSGDSVIFAVPDRATPKLLAVYDYNPATPDVTDAKFMRHRAEYAVQTSDEWKAWLGINGKLLDARTFAEFLEDRIGDVISAGEGDAKLAAIADLLRGSWASAPILIGLSRSLQVSVASSVKQATTLATGEISVAYETVHNDGAGQPLKVPNLFLIAIPVFYRGDRFPIVAKLRYRVDGGHIKWSVILHQPEKAFDEAFDELCAGVAGQTALPLFRGTPEA